VPMKEPRVLTIQDYSCLGRCSLTVALPTLSCAGIEAVGIPTSVLTNHTAFPSWDAIDTIESLSKASERWDEYRIDFDAVYTGYLATNQVDTALRFVAHYKSKGAKVFVDPAFADNGKLYAGFTQDHISALRKLLKEADLAKPNLTEACFLTSTPYPKQEPSETFLKELCKEMTATGPKSIVLSGIKKGNEIGCLIYERGEFSSFYLPAHRSAHGTGDLFSSALLSSILLGHSLKESAFIAASFVSEALRHNEEDNVDGAIYGPEFEKAIPYFIKKLGL
jgi:pyridoxine kinase